MYEEWEFTDQFMRDMTDNFQRYMEANLSHLKSVECKAEILEDRLVTMEKEFEKMQLLIEMLRKENESLKAYIKSGEKIVKLEKDFQ
jgi:hypothetical protein